MSQTARNYRVAFKQQSAVGTIATRTDAERLRMVASPGLNEASDPLVSEENRPDLQPQMGRMGARSTSGTYETEVSLGAQDTLLQAYMRGTWQAAQDLDETDVGQITVAGSVITAATGSFLDEGVRVGDMVTLSGTSEADNNNRVLRVTGVTATTVTVAESLVTIAAASDFDLRIARRLVNPASIVRRVFTFEQFMADLGESELFVDTRVTSLGVNATANTLKRFSFGLTGRLLDTWEDTGSPGDPYFTAPTAPGTIPIVTVDGTLRFGGEDVAVVTGFTLTGDLNAQTVPVVGSRLSPDVYDNQHSVSAQLTAIRRDLQNVARYLAEEELELHMVFRTPGAEPRPFLSLFVPNVKLAAPQKNLGGDGPMIETVPLIVGVKPAETGYEETTLKWSTSYTP